MFAYSKKMNIYIYIYNIKVINLYACKYMNVYISETDAYPLY